MMTEPEGNHYLNLLITLAKAFIDSEVTWADIEEISYQVRQGKPFNAAVDQLNLNQQVSPDLSVIMSYLSD
jgi:hypothetical protein